MLRTSASSLLSNTHRGKRLRQLFIEDVRDMEKAGAASESDVGKGGNADETGVGYMMRRAAVETMWRSWGPLFTLSESR